jgi:cardiolipin synthase (CMP-forming)
MSGAGGRRQGGDFAIASRPVGVADYLSLARIPLGVMFLGVAARPLWALVVLALAALTDVLDGWVARRCGPRPPGEPHRGDWLDPLCDKLFAAAVVAGLLVTNSPPLPWLVLLLLREILQLIAVTVLRLVPALHRVSRDYDFRAHPVGKATTVAQFVASALLVVNHPLAGVFCALCAVLGVASVAIYIHRIRGLLRAPPPHSP